MSLRSIMHKLMNKKDDLNMRARRIGTVESLRLMAGGHCFPAKYVIRSRLPIFSLISYSRLKHSRFDNIYFYYRVILRVDSSFFISFFLEHLVRPKDMKLNCRKPNYLDTTFLCGLI